MNTKGLYGKKRNEGLTRTNSRRSLGGFTIIEVMIVLAIAGLIMLIVFLAVPALQRNSRNTQRKNDVSRLIGLVNEFVSNNQGKLPMTLCSSGASCASTALDIRSENWSVINTPSNIGTSVPGTVAQDTAYIIKGARCNGNAVTTGASSRSFVVYYSIEASGGNTNQCQPG